MLFRDQRAFAVTEPSYGGGAQKPLVHPTNGAGQSSGRLQVLEQTLVCTNSLHTHDMHSELAVQVARGAAVPVHIMASSVAASAGCWGSIRSSQAGISATANKIRTVLILEPTARRYSRNDDGRDYFALTATDKLRGWCEHRGSGAPRTSAHTSIETALERSALALTELAMRRFSSEVVRVPLSRDVYFLS